MEEDVMEMTCECKLFSEISESRHIEKIAADW
jgi:hypothetical protein